MPKRKTTVMKNMVKYGQTSNLHLCVKRPQKLKLLLSRDSTISHGLDLCVQVPLPNLELKSWWSKFFFYLFWHYLAVPSVHRVVLELHKWRIWICLSKCLCQIRSWNHDEVSLFREKRSFIKKLKQIKIRYPNSKSRPNIAPL